MADYIPSVPNAIIEKAIRFLSKPHISLLEGLAGHHKNIAVGGRNEVNDIISKQNIDIVIWNLKVTNRHPKFAFFGNQCYAKIYWDFIQSEGDLLWKTPTKEPEECIINTNPNLGENILTLNIGDSYTDELKSIGATNLTIPQGRSDEIYFLLTIRNHDVAYLIIKVLEHFSHRRDNERGILSGHVHEQPLFISIGETRTLGIRFNCKGYSEERYHRYSVNVKSWNDVELTKI